jgi:hypothetical protein
LRPANFPAEPRLSLVFDTSLDQVVPPHRDPAGIMELEQMDAQRMYKGCTRIAQFRDHTRSEIRFGSGTEFELWTLRLTDRCTRSEMAGRIHWVVLRITIWQGLSSALLYETAVTIALPQYQLGASTQTLSSSYKMDLRLGPIRMRATGFFTPPLR